MVAVATIVVAFTHFIRGFTKLNLEDIVGVSERQRTLIDPFQRLSLVAVHFYLLFFGLVALVLELNNFCCSRGLRRMIEIEAKFLSRLTTLGGNVSVQMLRKTHAYIGCGVEVPSTSSWARSCFPASKSYHSCAALT